VTPLAEALASREVPFLLATGYQGDQLAHPMLREAPRLAKPWGENDLSRALHQLWWQHRVRRCAQRIWEREGRPEGQAERHWFMAEAQLRATPPARAALAELHD
jgi:hypothetical protein